MADMFVSHFYLQVERGRSMSEQVSSQASDLKDLWDAGPGCRPFKLRPSMSDVLAYTFLRDRNTREFSSMEVPLTQVLTVVVSTRSEERDGKISTYLETTGWRSGVDQYGNLLLGGEENFAFSYLLWPFGKINPERDPVLLETAIELDNLRAESAALDLQIRHARGLRQENLYKQLQQLSPNAAYPKMMVTAPGNILTEWIQDTYGFKVVVFWRGLDLLDEHASGLLQNAYDNFDEQFDALVKRLSAEQMHDIIEAVTSENIKIDGKLQILPASFLPEGVDGPMYRFLDLKSIIDTRTNRSHLFLWNVDQADYTGSLQRRDVGVMIDFASKPARRMKYQQPAAQQSESKPEPTPAEVEAAVNGLLEQPVVQTPLDPSSVV